MILSIVLAFITLALLFLAFSWAIMIIWNALAEVFQISTITYWGVVFILLFINFSAVIGRLLFSNNRQ
jgi:hypothetical protein